MNDDTVAPVIINVQVGADRFYNAGFYGSSTIIANVEAGLVWNGHEATSQQGVAAYVTDPSITTTPPQYDAHATMVGFTLTGLGPPAPSGGYYWYQFGMAPGSLLISAGIATSFASDGSGQFDTSNQAFVYAYKTVMQDGTLVTLQTWFGSISFNAKADVINSSWGFDDPTGTQFYTTALDALAYTNHQTVCLAAGNHEAGTAQVIGPASGFNAISVGALASDTSNPPYSQTAYFSNTGPNDFYNPVTNTVIPNARPGVDIAAPGTDLILAAYTGATGSNSAGTDAHNGATDLYAIGAAGTSFASPIVAGGAALIVDAGNNNFGTAAAIDGRVVKAVLLNSADKTAGWTNNTVNVHGVLTTTQSLDYAVGAGALDLNRAYDQYLSGTTDVPGLTVPAGTMVQAIGWDFAQVNQGTPNVYLINRRLLVGEKMTATLNWFVNRSLTIDPSNAANDTATDVSFNNLDLQVWSVDAQGNLVREIADALSPYNNVDQLYFSIPADGDYAIEVLWAGNLYTVSGPVPTSEIYGLAWDSEFLAVPEPATVGLVAIPLMAALLRRRRAKL